MARFLADLKARLLQPSAASKDSLRIGLNDAAAIEALAALSLEEVRLAMEVVNEMAPGLDRTGFSMALMQRWASEDATGALAYFRTHRDEAGPFGTMWLTAIMIPWMEKEPAAAARELAATLKNEDDDILQGSIGNTVFMVAGKLAQADPGAALRYASDLPDWARDPARSAISKQVHDEGRENFLGAIRALPDGADKTAWQHAAATALAPVDAAAASQWIDSIGRVEEDRREATRAVFEKWKQHDPRAATEWAATRLPEAERSVLVTRAVESWAPREPNECGRWLGELPPGPELDFPVAAFVRSVRGKDPDSARAWAERITDPKLREQSLGSK
jgi:hypothetical protein